jgi:hypothetical protein
MCDTCIFRPGNLMHLNSDAVEMMVAESVKDDASIPCHERWEAATLYAVVFSTGTKPRRCRLRNGCGS